jgi:hypothetical protein
MMLHRFGSRSRNLIGCEVPLKLMNGSGNVFTTGTISSPPPRKGALKCVDTVLQTMRRGHRLHPVNVLYGTIVEDVSMDYKHFYTSQKNLLVLKWI